MQLISKTGTNQFRGTAYDFIRNDRFDAPPFGTVGDLPPFSLHQYGGNLGGPIVPQRTFFFVNFEGLQQRQTQSFTRFVPERRPLGPASSRRSPPWLHNTRPVAGTTSDPAIDEWNVAQEFQADETAPSFRVDHRFSSTATMFARYNFDNADIVSPTETGYTTNQLRPSNFTLQFQKILTNTIVNEVKFGYNASLREELRDGAHAGAVQRAGVRGADGRPSDYRGRPDLQRPR